MFKRMIPLQDFILLKIVEEPKGNIVVAELADVEPTTKAKVISLGDKVTLDIKVDDEVLFKPHLFDNVVVNGDTLLIGRQDGIIALW